MTDTLTMLSLCVDDAVSASTIFDDAFTVLAAAVCLYRPIPFGSLAHSPASFYPLIVSTGI